MGSSDAGEVGYGADHGVGVGEGGEDAFGARRAELGLGGAAGGHGDDRGAAMCAAWTSRGESAMNTVADSG